MELLAAWMVWLLEAIAKSVLIHWLIRLFWEPPFFCREHYTRGWTHGYCAGLATIVVVLFGCRLMDYCKRDRT